MIDEAIRRNRRRILVIASASIVNWTLLVGFLTWWLLWGHDDAPTGSPVTVALSTIALGGAIAAAVVWFEVWTVSTRTSARIGAVPIDPARQPILHHLLEELAIAAGIPAPIAAWIDDPAPNALAVGRRPSQTTIVVTRGLVESLRRDELEAVIAAEMWAVRRLDTAMQTIAIACTGSAISFHHFWRGGMRSWFLSVVTWPTMLVAELLRRSIRRHADFGADELAVATTRHPDALRRAIVRLRDDPAVVAALDARTAPLWFEPLPHDDTPRARELGRLLLSPTLDERLDRLERLGR